MNSSEPAVPRRMLLKAGAWGVPVIAAAVAVPTATASPVDDYALIVNTPQVTLPGRSQVTVTFPTSALPIDPATTTLRFEQVTGPGVVSGGSLSPSWTYVWNDADWIEFYPTAGTPATGSTFSLEYSAACVWSVTLTTPGGTFTGIITVTA